MILAQISRFILQNVLLISLLSLSSGDLSRKKKLLQKQAKGKKRMKAIGKVNVPQEAFMAVLKLDNKD